MLKKYFIILDTRTMSFGSINLLAVNVRSHYIVAYTQYTTHSCKHIEEYCGLNNYIIWFSMIKIFTCCEESFVAS